MKSNLDGIIDKLIGPTEVELKNEKIGDEGAKRLAEALEKNSRVTFIDLEENEIGDEGITLIVKALKQNNSLTQLNLMYNKIGDEGAKSIASLLNQNSFLNFLNLMFNKIGDKGAESIAEALGHNSTLNGFFFGSNPIGDKGATHIAELLKKNSNLDTLELTANQFGDNGVKKIAKELEKNTSLKRLYLEHNQISDEGAKSFVEVLKKNSSLTDLQLSSDGIKPDILDDIKREIGSNISYIEQTKAREAKEAEKEAAAQHIFNLLPTFLEKIDSTIKNNIDTRNFYNVVKITIPPELMSHTDNALKIAHTNLNKLIDIFTKAIEDSTKCITNNKENTFIKNYDAIKKWIPSSVIYKDFNRLPKHAAEENFLDIKQKIALYEMFKTLSISGNYGIDPAKEAFLKTLEIFEEFAVSDRIKVVIQHYAFMFNQHIEYIELLSQECAVSSLGYEMWQVLEKCPKFIDDSLKQAKKSIKLEAHKDIKYYEEAIGYLWFLHDSACRNTKAIAYNYIGDIHKQNGNFKEAILHYCEVLNKNDVPPSPDIYKNLSNALLSIKQPLLSVYFTNKATSMENEQYIQGFDKVNYLLHLGLYFDAKLCYINNFSGNIAPKAANDKIIAVLHQQVNKISEFIEKNGWWDNDLPVYLQEAAEAAKSFQDQGGVQMGGCDTTDEV